jgi:hypothetical protein
MQSDNHLQLLETSVAGSDKNRTFIVQMVTPAGIYFANNKSYRAKEFWLSIKHFLTHYLALIVLIYTIWVYIRESTQTRENLKVLEERVLQLNKEVDKLRYSK